MKKNFLILLTLAFLGINLSSCEDDFLEKEPTEFFTQAQVTEASANDPGVVEATVRGIYSLMVEPETGGSTGDDDFGQKGYDIFGDMLSGDMALSSSSFGWYRADITEFQAPTDFTRNRNRIVWRYYYRMIRAANATIAALDLQDIDVAPEDEQKKIILGQARASRAHSYFYLTQYFANDYNPSAEILPLYDDIDDLNGPKVATSVIYELMENDLRFAITFLEDFNRFAKNEINKSVAQGILAYVLGSKRDSWEEVATLTQDVINTGGFTLMSAEEITGGFDDVNTPGWMWGIDLTIELGLDLVSWWGQMDSFSFSYAWAGDFKAIDQALYDTIPEDDARKEQFRDAEHPDRPLLPLNKFYHEDRVIGGQRNIETDYVYMRVAEMYLLNAEALAKSGNEPAARIALKQLLDERIPNSSYIDGLSGQALLDEIYLQTRIELWGEGKSYLAMKRNQATITRGANHLSNVGIPIDHDDERLTFEIPELEIQNNPFISTQNE